MISPKKYFLKFIRNYFLFPFVLFSVQSFATNEVIYIWCGAVTPTSVKVNAKLTDTSSTVRLVVATDSLFTTPLFSNYYSVDTSSNKMVSMEIDSLNIRTKYFYAVESSGIIDSSYNDIGSFKTFDSIPFSFSFCFGSCCVSSNHPIFDVMKNKNPDFFMNIGDLHYMDPNSTNVNVHWAPYETQVLSQQRASAFFKKIPFVYTWDDHDFSGNDSDSSAVGKESAWKAYRDYVPHYPLPSGDTGGIYQSFTIGRIHFILSDVRSDRYGISMLGPVQKQWLKNECIYARENDLIIAWVNSVCWNGFNQSDNWAGFPAERAELGNFFRDSLITNMFILSGDAHMLAIDNGSHSDFATFITNPYQYPIFQAAALNHWGSIKGGTFSEGGVFPNPSIYYGQFGLVTVTDTGGANVCVKFEGFRTDTLGNDTLINSYSFCRIPGAYLNVTETLGESLISVFPNPADENIFVSLNNSGELILFNSLAEKIVSRSLEPGKNEINISELSVGVYFLKIKTGDQIFIKKLVVCRN